MSDRHGLRALPTLAEVLDAPERALELPAAEAAAMFAKAEGVAAVLRARLTAAPATPTSPPDRLLTAKEAAPLLGKKPRDLYGTEWPFLRRLGPGTLRYSAQGIADYIAGRTR